MDDLKSSRYDFNGLNNLTDALNLHLFDGGSTIAELETINEAAQRHFKVSRTVVEHCIGMRNKRNVPLYVNGDLFKDTAKEFKKLPRDSVVWFDQSHMHRFLRGIKQEAKKIRFNLEKSDKNELKDGVQIVKPTEKHVREAIGMVKGQQVKITDIFEHIESLGETKGYRFVEGWKVEVENILESMLQADVEKVS